MIGNNTEHFDTILHLGLDFFVSHTVIKSVFNVRVAILFQFFKIFLLCGFFDIVIIFYGNIEKTAHSLARFRLGGEVAEIILLKIAYVKEIENIVN